MSRRGEFAGAAVLRDPDRICTLRSNVLTLARHVHIHNMFGDELSEADNHSLTHTCFLASSPFQKLVRNSAIRIGI